MELTSERRCLLTAALDTLLPGDASWPAAGMLGLSDRVAALAELDPTHPDLLGDALLELGADFAGIGFEDRTKRLASLENDHPEPFGVLLLLCYNAYYTDLTVLKVVESRTGYEARPPQPLGYHMEPFDESLLEKVRARPPFWRRV